MVPDESNTARFNPLLPCHAVACMYMHVSLNFFFAKETYPSPPFSNEAKKLVVPYILHTETAAHFIFWGGVCVCVGKAEGRTKIKRGYCRNRLVRHYGICVSKRREGDGAHVTTHTILGM